MYVCMYVCMYVVCMYVCMRNSNCLKIFNANVCSTYYVIVYVCMYVCMYVE